MTSLGEQIQVRINWGAVEDATPLHANQVLAQLGAPGSGSRPDGVIITFGSAPTPPLMGDRDPENTKRLVERLRAEGIRVNVLGQYHVTRQLLDEVIKLLQETATKYDEAEAAAAADGKE